MAIIGTNDTASVRVASLPSGAAFDNAANVAVTPTGGISATNVQGALEELDTEKAPLASPNFTGTLGVGTSSGQSRLRVAAAATVNAPTLGSVLNYHGFTSNIDPSYGLGWGSSAADGHVWLQAQRADGNTIAYNITLNEAGGGVGVGTASVVEKLTVSGAISASTYIKCGSYTVGTVPAASVGAGSVIYVSNESGGAVIAFSDGTNWRRVTDRAIIS